MDNFPQNDNLDREGGRSKRLAQSGRLLRGRLGRWRWDGCSSRLLGGIEKMGNCQRGESS